MPFGRENARGAAIARHATIVALVNTDFGVYVHVPYCRERCLYCDFALTPVNTVPSAAFADAAVAELFAIGEREIVPGVDLSRRFENRRAVSLYFGGGTPSMLDPRDIARIVDAVARKFGLEPDAEITLEANPEDASSERFAAFRAAGVNRLSLGVQSLEDRFLRSLGRAHDTAAAEASVRAARAAGIDAVSLDLIFGVEGMSLADWDGVLGRALALEPTHLSCYGLTVERGTKLHRMVARGDMALPEDDLQASMYELAGARLAAGGKPRYEISNYAAPADRAVHNSLYWRYAEWIGIGPSSHSFVRVENGGARWWNGKNPFAYLRSAGHPHVSGHEVITGRSAMGEMAFTAMRTADGLTEEAFRNVFGVALDEVFGTTFRRLVGLGLASRDARGVRLTDRGFLVSDSVFGDLVEIAA